MKKTTRVLIALHNALDEPGGGWLTGLDLRDRCGLLPGTTYPILSRLQHRGEAESRREPAPTGIRVFYRLTSDGVRRRQRSQRRRGSWAGLLARARLSGVE